MSPNRLSLTWIYVICGVIAFITCFGTGLWLYSCEKYDGETGWVYIPSDASESSIRDSLCSSLGEGYGSKVFKMWEILSGNGNNAHGAYKVERGMRALAIANALKHNRQTPIRVTFNNVRIMPDLADKVSSKLHFSDVDFLKACDTLLPRMGFERNHFLAAFIPDTYEFYWTSSPQKVVETLVEYRNKFWDESRKSKSDLMKLSPIEIATVASIVEEESSKRDEYGSIARLYLNRVEKGMKLQADPTVKFALGDFSIRRITQKHTQVSSPYNTYQVGGLPPGPIRIAEKSTIDEVLNAPNHEFLYMCAKEDFSGYHNFAKDYSTHQANARKYHNALNKRGIK